MDQLQTIPQEHSMESVLQNSINRPTPRPPVAPGQLTYDLQNCSRALFQDQTSFAMNESLEGFQKNRLAMLGQNGEAKRRESEGVQHTYGALDHRCDYQRPRCSLSSFSTKALRCLFIVEWH